MRIGLARGIGLRCESYEGRLLESRCRQQGCRIQGQSRCWGKQDRPAPSRSPDPSRGQTYVLSFQSLFAVQMRLPKAPYSCAGQSGGTRRDGLYISSCEHMLQAKNISYYATNRYVVSCYFTDMHSCPHAGSMPEGYRKGRANETMAVVMKVSQ